MSLRQTTQRADAMVAQVFGAREAESREGRDWMRSHLGASVLGHKCDRYLWLHFRWARDPRHDGRRLRIFERGNLEEDRIKQDLVRIGWEILNPGEIGAPRRASFADGQHLGGTGDFFIRRLVGPIKMAGCEVKTANEKSFARIQREGVRQAKPDHYAQMQVYMAEYRQSWWLYVAVNKNTEEIHMEWVSFDEQFALDLIERGNRIVSAKEPPNRLAANEYPPCRWTSVEGEVFLCDYYKICHVDELPERNCRTCVHVTPAAFGRWVCEEQRGKLLSPDAQRRGCGSHRWIPPVINAQVAQVGLNENGRAVITYQAADGSRFADAGPSTWEEEQ